MVGFRNVRLGSGGLGTGQAGELLAQQQAGAEEGDIDLRGSEVKGFGDPFGVIALDIAQEEDHALGGGEMGESGLQIGTLDVALRGRWRAAAAG